MLSRHQKSNKKGTDFNIHQLQKQPPEVFLEIQACNFIKKATLTQVFSCEFCEISKNTFFIEHLWATASTIKQMRNWQLIGKRKKSGLFTALRKAFRYWPHDLFIISLS